MEKNEQIELLEKIGILLNEYCKKFVHALESEELTNTAGRWKIIISKDMNYNQKVAS